MKTENLKNPERKEQRSKGPPRPMDEADAAGIAGGIPQLPSGNPGAGVTVEMCTTCNPPVPKIFCPDEN